MKGLRSILLLLVVQLAISNRLYPQDWGRYWCFGDSAGIDFSDPAYPIPTFSEMDCAESYASVGDSIHGLLLYVQTDYWPR